MPDDARTPAQPQPPKSGASQDDFARMADKSQPGVILEFWDFLRHTKKWWLTPIVLVLLAIGVFVLLSATAAGPLIYTLF